MPVLPLALTVTLAGLFGLVAGAYANVAAERAVAGRRLLLPVPRPRELAGAGPRSGVPTVAGTSAVCVALGASLGPVAALPAYLYLATISAALAMIDIRTRRLPNALTLPAYPVGVALLAVAVPFTPQGRVHLVAALAGMAGMYACYLLLFVVYPKGMGFGDVKLAGVLGLFLAWLGIDVLLVGAFLGYLLGGAYGLVAILAGRATRKTAIPFGPFMIAGALLSVVAGEQLAALYLRL